MQIVVLDFPFHINSWRGSDIEYIRRFTRDFPGATQIRLEENFRSTGHILDAANAVIAQDPGRLGKTLYTRKESGDRIEVVHFRNPETEVFGIVHEMLKRNAEGVAWDEMGLLYRANAQSRLYEESLLRARIPFVLVGDLGYYQRPEIKDALALLRLAATPDDVQADEALRRVVNTPPRGFGAKAMRALEDEAAWRRVPMLAALETAALPPKARAAGLAFADAVRGVGQDDAATLADQLSLLLDRTGYRAMLRESRAETTEGRLDNLQELIQLAGSFHTARDLLDHAALCIGGPNEEAAERVRLMTLHKSKGLEFGHVFLPGWELGSFPSLYGDPAEERRLAYMAITRGMRRVTISHCDFRHGYTMPCPFLKDIPDQHRFAGWLRGPPSLAPRPRAVPADALDGAALLRQFER